MTRISEVIAPGQAFALDSAHFLTEVLRLESCQSMAQVHELLSFLSRKLGFDAFLYGARFFPDGHTPVETVVSSYDAPWREKYDRDGYSLIDPTVAHSMSSVTPLIWTDQMYQGQSALQFREEAHCFNLVAGATFPVQNREGGVGMLSFSLSSAGPDAQGHIREMLVWGPLIASMAHEAMRRIMKQGQKNVSLKLTRRETDVLKWIAAGKSTWEISKVLHITEHGVIHHVRNLLLKFDVTSRHQAVLKAIACGLL